MRTFSNHFFCCYNRANLYKWHMSSYTIPHWMSSFPAWKSISRKSAMNQCYMSKKLFILQICEIHPQLACSEQPLAKKISKVYKSMPLTRED